MHDVKQIYELTTGLVPPLEPGALERQRKAQTRHMRNRKIEVFAVVAVMAVLAFLAVRVTAGDAGRKPASTGTSDEPTVTVTPRVGLAPQTEGSLTTAPWVGTSAVPDVDYFVDLNTGAMTPLPEAIFRSSFGGTYETGLANSHYAVSPDGSELAYVGTGDDGSSQILIAGIDGTGIRQVTHDPLGADWPAWSPDGAKIAYMGVAEGRYCCSDLFILTVATGEATRIVHGEAWDDSGLQFTPDGSSLVYTGGHATDPAEMRSTPLAGGQSTILFGGGHRGIGHAGGGSLSPDGSLVTFMGHEIGGPGAARFVANDDGTELRIIPGREANPGGLWSPDGSRIVALKPDTRHGDIIVVDVVSGDALVVAEGNEAIWLDEHTLLVEV